MSDGSGVTGRVVGLQRSGGGVPKLPIDRVAVSLEGIERDWQRNRKHHGGPDRALCLYSMDLIDALVQEGHPIYPGATGENVTVAGLDWSNLTLGARLKLGTVEVQVTDYAWPCNTIAAAFRDGQFNRISPKRHPGWSRVYTRVLRAGHIEVGNTAERLP